jgi:hypothetical protein
MTRTLTRFAKVVVGTLVVLFLFVGWYCIAANYDYTALAGTYIFHDDKVSAILLLRSDKSFHQEITEQGKRRIADGIWHRSGQAGTSFSKEFLRIPGAKTFTEEFGMSYGNEEDSEYFGRFEKIGGIYPILKLNANPPGPTLYKKPFR